MAKTIDNLGVCKVKVAKRGWCYDYPDESDPPNWDTTVIAVCLGMLAGFILAWLPAALIIYRLWR